MTFGERFNKLVGEMRRANSLNTALIPPFLLVCGVLFILQGCFDPDQTVWSAVVGVGMLALAVMFFRAYQRPLPPLPPVVHTASIVAYEDVYYAHCSCGWTGDESDSRQVVEAEATQHAPDVSIEVDPTPRNPSILGLAYVSREVFDRGLPVLVLYRENPEHTGDSGWRMQSGREIPSEAASIDSMVPRDMAEIVERDHTLADVVFTKGPCAFERDRVDEPFRRVALDFGTETS